MKQHHPQPATWWRRMVCTLLGPGLLATGFPMLPALAEETPFPAMATPETAAPDPAATPAHTATPTPEAASEPTESPAVSAPTVPTATPGVTAAPAPEPAAAPVMEPAPTPQPVAAAPGPQIQLLSAQQPAPAANLAQGGKTGAAVTVDGQFDESVWQQASAYSIEYLADFTISNNQSQFQAAWDDDNLYLGFRIQDADVVTDFTSDNIYENDSVEIFLDADNSKTEKYDKVNDYHIYIQYDGKIQIQGGAVGTWANTEIEGLQHAVYMTGNGFSVEVAIPFNSLGITPGDGTCLGLSMSNNDNDSHTGSARKEILWNPGHQAASPATWGTLCLYETRPALVSTYGSPDGLKNDDDWDASLWNFNETYQLHFADIPGATVKFASLSDYSALYFAMLIEDAGDQAPYVEVILSGDNKRSGARGTYDYVLQWNPCETEAWAKMNITNKEGNKPESFKYSNLGEGTYAVVVRFPWAMLSEVPEDSETPRPNYSCLSFSAATGIGKNQIQDGDNTRWTATNAWGGDPLGDTATLLINNPNLYPAQTNTAPDGTPFYSVSIPQGGMASGQVSVTDPEKGDTLTFALEDGYDPANGAVTVDEQTGAWIYTAPADLLTGTGSGVNFFIVTTDAAGERFRTRVQILVEPEPANRTWYVDGDTGNDANDGLSPDNAFKTINAAHDRTAPGDTVEIAESETPYGWYTEAEYAADPDLYASVRDGAVVITRSGLPDAPITYRAAEGEQPVIQTNGTWKSLVVAASYVNIEGLTVRGVADTLTYEDAYRVFWGKIAPEGDPDYSTDWDYACGLYNTNGIGIEPLPEHEIGEAGVTDPNVRLPHHVTISDCVVAFMPGTGIGGSQCDYVTIDNCTSVNNSWWDMWGTSGIGFIETADVDDNTTDYKLVVRDSISAGNRHFIPWKSGTVRLSDGNGIILDTLDDHEHDYQGRILIANNLAYENGGSGIHTFRSDNVDMVNNTVFNNGTTPELGWSEMFANDAENVNMVNNIVYSRTGNKEDIKSGTVSGVSYGHNLFYNYADGSTVGTEQPGVTMEEGNLFGQDPMFANVTPVVEWPEGFDPDTDYPQDWYEIKTARDGTTPAQWSCAANAKAAGWYPGVNYDVTVHSYDFTLFNSSPAQNAADPAWAAAAGVSGNVLGASGTVGSALPVPAYTDTPDQPEPPEEEKPEDPDSPAEPDEPVQPESPVDPDQPARPENPETQVGQEEPSPSAAPDKTQASTPASQEQTQATPAPTAAAGEIPATGDPFALGLCLVLVLASGTGLTCLLWPRKRSRQE